MKKNGKYWKNYGGKHEKNGGDVDVMSEIMLGSLSRKTGMAPPRTPLLTAQRLFYLSTYF